MIWTIVGIIIIFWLFGFAAHLGGDLIHLLLLVALIALVFNFFSRRN
jgi:hypothetical protein